MENRERELSLSKLIWKLILSWRYLLVWGVGFAILLTAIFYLKDYRSYQATLNWQPQAEQSGAVQFTDIEKEQIESVKSLQQMLNRYEHYLEESILMNINPYEEHVLVLQYYVDSDYTFNYTETNIPDYTTSVVAAYTEYVQNGELAGKLVKELGLDNEEKYMQELISVQEVSSSTVLSSDTVLSSSTILSSSNVFSIRIVYPQEVVLQEVAEIIRREMNAKTADIAEGIGSHSLELLSESIGVKIDGDLASQQKEYEDIIYNYRNQLKSLVASMTEAQLEEVERSTMGIESVDTAPIAVKPTVSIKYIILGFVVGMFLAVVWIVCKVLFAVNLQDSDELSEIYGLRLFGVLEVDKKLNSLDKILLRWKNCHKKQLSLEQNLDIIISNIDLTCKKENVNRIFLTGSEIEKVDKELFRHIVEKLEKAGIEVVYGENICYAAMSLRKMAEVGYVVVIEQTGVSKYQEIEQEIGVIMDQKVQFLGCIGIDTVCI